MLPGPARETGFFMLGRGENGGPKQSASITMATHDGASTRDAGVDNGASRLVI